MIKKLLAELKRREFHLYFFFLILILVFYWSLSLARVMPKMDGVIPLSFYSYLYSGYLTYNKILFWNPYLAGGGIDNIMVYIYMGYSPLNPIVHLWLPVSKFFHIPIIQSFYLYYLIHIYLATLAVYLLGKKFFFKNTQTSVFFAVAYAISGYYVSMMGLMYFIIPFSWFPITLFFGLLALKRNNAAATLLFALTSSLLVINGTTVSIPITVYLAIFIIVFSVFESRQEGQQFYRCRIKQILLFLVFFSLLTLAPLLYYYQFSTNLGYHLTGDPSVFFLGKRDALLTDSVSGHLMLNIFIPDTALDRWFNYGENGYWNNAFTYLGFISPILLLLGIYSFKKHREYLPVLYSVLASTLFAFIFVEGHSFLKTFSPQINLLVKYSTFGTPLLLFSFIVIMSYGFDYLFESENQNVNLNKVFLTGAIILTILTPLILFGIKMVIPEFSTTDNLGYPDKTLPIQLLEIGPYVCLIAFLYLIPVFLKNKKLFIGIFILDLFLFLSQSRPLVEFPLIEVGKSDIPVYVDAKTKMVVPKVMNYGITGIFPGVHYAVGPTLFREPAIPAIPAIPNSLMNLRRAYWADQIFAGDFTSQNDMITALNILGVSRKRYFFSDAVWRVNDYAGIFSKLKEIYNSDSRPVVSEPVVVSTKTPPVLNDAGNSVPPKIPVINGVYKGSENISDLLQTTLITGTDLQPTSFPSVLQYTKDLPVDPSIVTEQNSIDHLCLDIKDSAGNIYYPMSQDIFNFNVSQGVGDTTYSINNEYFYAIYITRSGTVKLFLRAPVIPQVIYLVRNTDCQSNQNNNYSLATKHLKLSARDFLYSDYENGYTVYTTGRLVTENAPTYLIPELQRISVKNVTTHKTLSLYNYNNDIEGFTYKGGLLKIYRRFNNDPYLKDNYEVSYSVLNRNLYDQMNELQVVSETPDKIQLITHRANISLLVLRNVYSPYWNIKIDGKNTPVIAANGLYTAAEVPAGTHTVIAEYKPLFMIIMIWLVPFYGILLPLFLIWKLRDPDS